MSNSSKTARQRKPASRAAARSIRSERERKIIAQLNAGVSIANIAAREDESEPHAAKPRNEMLFNPLKTNNPAKCPNFGPS